MRRHPTLSAGLLVAAALAQQPLAGCASPPAASNVELVQQFRAHLRSGEYDAARAMMTPDPRRWFNERSGEGGPWRVGPGAEGPWALWDGAPRPGSGRSKAESRASSLQAINARYGCGTLRKL